ncbi:MAG: hypothetical protein JWN38_1012 [Candidatus Saccharibacteria bacterium]|nr:hypothetical protein [Candidatus Saccharibacteria bacterium]
MHQLIRRIRKRYVIVTGLIVVALVALVFASSLFRIPVLSSTVDSRLKAHDIAVTNREMTAARATLVPLLAPLNIGLLPQVGAFCSEGDPSLYAHLCGTQSDATYIDNTLPLQSADTISKHLQTIDVALRKDGWSYDGNDFRYRYNQPPSTWTQILQAYSIGIAYRKGTCNFHIALAAPNDHSLDRSRGPGNLSCYISSGRPTVNYQ